VGVTVILVIMLSHHRREAVSYMVNRVTPAWLLYGYSQDIFYTIL